MTKEKKIPELRFPEFKGEWIEKILSDLFTFKNGINAAKEDYGDGYKFINVLDIIQNDYITHDKIIGSVKISETEFNKNIVEYGDILFQRSSETREEVGQANVYLDKELPATFGGFVIRGKQKAEYDPSFMNYLLKTSRSRKEITSKSGGSTRYNVGQSTLSEVSILTTVFKEQQKIASFITAVDQRIQLLKKKKEVLEEYKKGVMQKIFLQEIRFRDEKGKDYPDWEEKRLGEIGEIITGKTPSTTNKSLWNGEIDFITPTDINEKLKYQVEVSRTIKSNKKIKILPKSTIVYTCIASIGKMALTTKPSITNQQINSLIPFKQYDNEFIYYSLLWLTPKIKATQANTTLPIINKSEFSKFRISIPNNLEQQKIALFLGSLDNLIETKNIEIVKSKEFKKGLLQKMFV